jgi:hypothetical protein
LHVGRLRGGDFVERAWRACSPDHDPDRRRLTPGVLRFAGAGDARLPHWRMGGRLRRPPRSSEGRAARARGAGVP